VSLESQAIATFRLTLAQHLELCRIRTELEETAHDLLQDQLITRSCAQFLALVQSLR
jgi:hypothetical protein